MGPTVKASYPTRIVKFTLCKYIFKNNYSFNKNSVHYGKHLKRVIWITVYYSKGHVNRSGLLRGRVGISVPGLALTLEHALKQSEETSSTFPNPSHGQCGHGIQPWRNSYLCNQSSGSRLKKFDSFLICKASVLECKHFYKVGFVITIKRHVRFAAWKEF